MLVVTYSKGMTFKFMLRFWNHYESLKFFNHPKVTATLEYRPHLAAKFESNGSRYFQNSR